MVSYNYKFDNFLGIPEDGDIKLRIYDRNNTLRYTIDPFFNYLYSKNNYVFIKIEDEKEIILDFENENEALRAITKLNQYKKLFVNKKITDTPYYTKEQSDALFLKYLSMSGLTDVTIVNPQVGNILVYSANNTWEISSYNYFNPQFYYTTAQTFNQQQVLNITGLTNYYTATQIETIFSGITLSGLSLNSLSDVKTYSPALNDILIYTGSLWTNTGMSNYIVTKPELFTLFIPLTGSSQITGNLIPATTGLYSLGSPTGQWKDIYVSGSTIYLDLKPLKINNSNNLEFNGDELATTAFVLYSGGTKALSGLSDVVVISPLNNDILVYNTGQWYNQPLYYYVYSKSEVYNTGQTLSTQEINDLISASGGTFDPSKYYTTAQTYSKSEVYNTGEINNFFNNYYTKTEVNSLLSGITTGSTDLSAYYTSAQTNSLFIALTGSSGITGDLTPATDGGASLGSLTNQWKSLYVSGKTIYIDKKPITVESDNSLSYNGDVLATQSYVNFSASTSKLSGLTDVTISSVTNGQVLMFSGNTWVNKDIAVVSGGTFDPALYYTKTDLQTSGGTCYVNWNNITYNPFVYKGVVQGGSHVLDFIPSGNSFSVSWEYSINNLTTNAGVKIAYVMACWNNYTGEIEYAETSTKSIGDTSDFDTKYSIISDGTNILFYLTGPSDLWDVRLIRRNL